jgi:hypothetical protein
MGSPGIQQTALSFGPFIIVEEVGPPHLRDFMLQRKFWATLIEEPSSRNQGYARCEDSLRGSRGS